MSNHAVYPNPPSSGVVVSRANSAPLGATQSVAGNRQRPSIRLVNVIVDPAAAFRAIDDDAPWGLAFIASVALRFGSLFVFYRPDVTLLKVLGGLLFQISAVGPRLLVAAAVLWIAGWLANLRVSWRVNLSIVAHVYVVYTLATILIASAAGALLPESIDVDLRNPPFTNLGFLAGEATSHILRKVLEQIDARSAYGLLLLWVGLRGAAPSGGRTAVTMTVVIFGAVRMLAVVVIAASR